MAISVEVVWSYCYTNWDLQRDEGSQIGAIDQAPLRVWRTMEEAKAAAEASHREDYDGDCQQWPEMATEEPYQPLEWHLYLFDRFDDGDNIECSKAGEDEVENWWVYPIRMEV